MSDVFEIRVVDLYGTNQFRGNCGLKNQTSQPPHTLIPDPDSYLGTQWRIILLVADYQVEPT